MMALQGECVTTGAPLPHLGAMPQICNSPAGHYIGYLNTDGSPYSRESEYYPDREAALEAWKAGAVAWRGSRGITYPSWL